VNLPPVGSNLPFCSGACPQPFKKCIRFRKDLNGNGDPEWFCKCVPVIKPLPDTVHPAKVRYISFESDAAPGELEAVHYRAISLNGLPPGVPYEGWLTAPGMYPEGAAPLPTFIGAQTGCVPNFADWAALGLAHATGPDVIPFSSYELRTVSSECEDLTEPECYSDPLAVSTQRWGDVVPAFGGMGQPNFLDISADVDAFKGFPYPYSGPCTCPPAAVCPVLDACGRCSP
jgi:hypothetical protein